MKSICVVAALLLVGCAPFAQQIAPNPEYAKTTKPRKLFVFLDGTSNDWRTRTNVRRLFELVAAQESPERLCLWVEGVGTQNNLLGIGFGLGLNDRVEAAYAFLADNYRAGGPGRMPDEIYIFGFSRGAWEARTLCGMLAHAGLYRPTVIDQNTGKKEIVPAHQIYTAVTTLPEPQWPNLPAEQQRPKEAAALAANQQKMEAEFGGKLDQKVRVKFLGLWDTVAGLQITKISGEGEQTNVDPQTGVLTPRYKVRPYPNIDKIVHAMAIDEQRSQFRPTRVGPPLDPAQTQVFEVWFPGVHSDIGGGYADSNALASVPLNWMMQLLGPDKLIPGHYKVAARATGIMHHSELDRNGAFGSHPMPRVLPVGAMVHESFLQRVEARKEVEENLPIKGGLYVMTRYRPDVSVQEVETNGEHHDPQRPFLIKPPETESDSSPEAVAKARLNWQFDTALWQKDFPVVVKTESAKAHPLKGKPLTAKASVVQHAGEAPIPAAMQAPPAAPGKPTPVPGKPGPPSTKHTKPTPAPKSKRPVTS